MPLPTVDQLKRPTLVYLEQGVTDSDSIRDRLASDFGLTGDDLALTLQNRIPTFVNNHAWALVRLQNGGLIQRAARKSYVITEAGRAFLRGQVHEDYHVEPPRPGQMPVWARRWIYAANRKNSPDGPPFTEDDLLELWQRCGGRCAVTKLPFSEEKVGLGKAKRAFAPSIDKIDPAGFYTLDNCRLVMVAINFAINSWGLAVYRKLARAAIAAMEDARQAPS
jgi:Mrr N-terminal domain